MDSEERREFKTGAARDMAKGKGRFDLMPLEEVAEYLYRTVKSSDGNYSDVLYSLASYQKTNDENMIYSAIFFTCKEFYKTPYEMLLELAKHFENGANKYGEYNWQKGIPKKSYIDSALRHLTKAKIGIKEENHKIACIWNLFCLAWTHNNIQEGSNE